MTSLPRCIIFEDDHLLVVNKPAGLNTHSPSPYAGEGIYEWLVSREPRWGSLAIIHRLDKTTSGVMVFGKSTAANRSLTTQFTEHSIRKKYRLATDRAVDFNEQTVRSSLVRVGEKYDSRPVHKGGELAETIFRKVSAQGNITTLEATPLTGKTHQIRSHAASLNIPILGDVLYGGTTAKRIHLHAAELKLNHPVTGQELSFASTCDFNSDVSSELRKAFIETEQTDAWRLWHGAADRHPGWYVEKLGAFLLSQSAQSLDEEQVAELRELMAASGARGVYQKTLLRQVRQTSTEEVSPQHILGEASGETFCIRENGVAYEMSFGEGYSVGLFLDQRDNRRRLLTNHVTKDFPVFSNGAEGATLLNTFSYTCGFSACAAKAGAKTTSLDLSKKYLDWGKRNFALNHLDAKQHDFIFGDVFDWMRRLHKKARTFDAIILDPPTFSQSKQTGRFSAENDYGRLMELTLPLLNTNGVILASTNAAKLAPEDFIGTVTASIAKAGRKISRSHYAPQPPDFPVSREEPAYLKTYWVQVR